MGSRNISLRSDNAMVIIITGNIATGKSYILNIFNKLGFYLIKMDQFTDYCFKNNEISKNIVQNLSKVLNIDLTDQLISSDTGIIDKEKLLDILFYSYKNVEFSYKISAIEEIIFPIALEYQLELVQRIAIKGGRSIVIESPLFFEANSRLKYNTVIMVTASEAIQKKRAFMRKNMTNEKFFAIVDKQLAYQNDEKQVNLVLLNEGNRCAIINSIKSIIRGHTNAERGCIRYRNYRT